MRHQPVLPVRAGDVAQNPFSTVASSIAIQTVQVASGTIGQYCRPGDRRLLAVERRLGEKAHVPEGDIRPDQLLTMSRIFGSRA